MSKTPGDRPIHRLDDSRKVNAAAASPADQEAPDAEAPETALPCERIGPYRLEERLGAGGMGAVYRAFDERLQRPVALKQILPDVADDPRLQARFQREARAAARLDHRGIVRVFDVLDENDCKWIVMELVEGRTLSEILEEGPLPAAEVLSLGADIAEALAVAHGEGIVHRDLKASNVLVTSAGRAKILDFGLAKSVVRPYGDSSTISEVGQVVGTPHAMSPEQATGHKVGPLSDLFALGTLLYEMLTTISPFRGDNAIETLTRVCTHKQEPLRNIVDSVPEPLVFLVDHLLKKNPGGRPRSATDVALRLRRLAAGDDLRGMPSGDQDDAPTILSSALTTSPQAGVQGAGGRALAPLPPPPRNPFYHRQGITDPRHFFGRSDMVRSLLDMVNSGQSSAVVGERRIGKSSLLVYLSHPEVHELYGLEAAKVLPAFLDFLALHAASPEDLWAEILESLEMVAPDEEARATLRAVLEKGDVSFTILRRALRRLRRRGLRVVLFCDEFELAVQNPQFDQGFFGALRSLAGNEGVVFVTATRLNLLELEQYNSEELRRKVLGSPFFNIFAEFRLGPLEKHEVAELLACSLDRTTMRFGPPEVAWLQRVAGSHPYFLQLGAYHLYEYFERQRRSSTQEGALRSEDYEEPTTELRRESAKIFRNQWQHSDERERRVLATLAAMVQGGRGNRAADHRVLQRLERRALVERTVPAATIQESSSSGISVLRQYRLFSDLFAEWILAEVTISAGTVDDMAEVRAKPVAAPPGPTERYSIVEELGRGGTGTVYKAWDERLQRIVAIKVLDPEIRAEPQHMDRLLAEARTCARLHHPHIVVVYDIDEDHGQLVQEFLAGGSLRDLLEAVPILSVTDVVSLARQLGGALAVAHEAGVVHRDLKPENVLLTERPPVHSIPSMRDDAAPGATPRLPTVKLGDFGTALRLSDLHSTDERRSVVGTLAYMAPEQLVGQRVGPASDFFALGMMLYEARHGARPTPVRAEMEAQGAAEIHGEDIDHVIARCLATDPRDRYREAAELLAVL